MSQKDIKLQFQQAKQLIQSRQYQEARTLLQSIDHPRAEQWIAKLDERLTQSPSTNQSQPKTQATATQSVREPMRILNYRPQYLPPMRYAEMVYIVFVKPYYLIMNWKHLGREQDFWISTVLYILNILAVIFMGFFMRGQLVPWGLIFWFALVSFIITPFRLVRKQQKIYESQFTPDFDTISWQYVYIMWVTLAGFLAGMATFVILIEQGILR
ncbi:MAG: hypothetical protein AAFV93_14545 [Chloroflexota bacterium]